MVKFGSILVRIEGSSPETICEKAIKTAWESKNPFNHEFGQEEPAHCTGIGVKGKTRNKIIARSIFNFVGLENSFQLIFPTFSQTAF